MKGKIRHDIAFRLGKIVIGPFIHRKFSYEHDIIKVDSSPYIVVSNHLTNWDPILIGFGFKKSMYYVATDHVFRMGFKSKLLEFFFSPIPRAKSAQDTQTVISIFRRLREKCNVCIFVEGNTSYDGETGEIQRSIGKLIKKSEVALVTYRFTGSYFTFPRWARFVRRGKMEGRLAQIYSPEKLAAMSEDEIYEAIVKDIYVNAYDEQKKKPIAFHGKNQAEFLETVLYCCPKCKQFSTLTSRGDRLFCSCGFDVRFNEYGYFEYADSQAETGRFSTIQDWSRWQRDETNALAEKVIALDSSAAVLSDRDQELFEIARASHNTFLAKGTLSLYRDRLSLESESGTIEFPFESIVDMSIITMMTIIFSTNEKKIFEVHSPYPRSALKYFEMFKALKAKE